MKRNDLSDKLYTLSAFARCDYPDKDVLADALLDAARELRKCRWKSQLIRCL
jgi:hypothetical protein